MHEFAEQIGLGHRNEGTRGHDRRMILKKERISALDDIRGYHIHYRFRHQMMPKTVNRRIGEKVSGLHRVMATEQKQIFTFVIPETNCDSSRRIDIMIHTAEDRNMLPVDTSATAVSDVFFGRYPLWTISGIITFIIDSDDALCSPSTERFVVSVNGFAIGRPRGVRNSGGASMSSWIRADHPMLNGGSMVTTILESIYARGSVTARQHAVLDPLRLPNQGMHDVA